MLYNDYGQLMARGNFKNDKLHGKFYTYGGDGRVLEKKKYWHGEEVIPWPGPGSGAGISSEPPKNKVTPGKKEKKKKEAEEKKTKQPRKKLFKKKARQDNKIPTPTSETKSVTS
jgi:hypothetical protein